MSIFLNIITSNLDEFIITLAIILLGLSLGWYIYTKLRKELKNVEVKGKGSGVFRQALVPVTFLMIIIALRLNIEIVFPKNGFYT